MELDIKSKGIYPANELSNFFSHEFIIDGVKCASMEGFLQSLKYRNINRQKKVCALSGKEAKDKGKFKFFWKLTGNLYWQGKKIKRTGSEYEKLLKAAYFALGKNARFIAALKASEGYTLTHSLGKHNPKKTVLTEEEFILQLETLRSNLK